MEKSYNRKGNLRFKSSNEAEKLVMEGRKAAGKLRKNLQPVNALGKSRKNKNHIFILYTTQGSELHRLGTFTLPRLNVNSNLHIIYVESLETGSIKRKKNY